MDINKDNQLTLDEFKQMRGTLAEYCRQAR
jgi:hypothetical protein